MTAASIHVQCAVSGGAECALADGGRQESGCSQGAAGAHVEGGLSIRRC